jgi:hypothetical protein
MEVNVKGASTWNLDFCNPAEAKSDKESVASEGSRITSTEETSMVLDVPTTTTTTTSTGTGAAVVTPCSPPASAIHSSGDIALEETPPDKRRTK